MRNTTGKIGVAVGVIAAIATLTTTPRFARAEVPGDHPHYMHALSDLRYARAYLSGGDEQNVERDADAGIIEIDQAIGEINRAAIDDGKNLNDHPPVDANLSHKDRLRRAAALLVSARNALRFEEDTKAALGWRNAAVKHLLNAYRDADAAIKADYHDDHPFVPGDHAHFLHALSDMRAARALLAAPEESNVKGDEMAATRSLDSAIRFAKSGAVDDGLNIFFIRPPRRTCPGTTSCARRRNCYRTRTTR